MGVKDPRLLLLEDEGAARIWPATPLLHRIRAGPGATTADRGDGADATGGGRGSGTVADGGGGAATAGRAGGRGSVRNARTAAQMEDGRRENGLLLLL